MDMNLLYRIGIHLRRLFSWSKISTLTTNQILGTCDATIGTSTIGSKIWRAPGRSGGKRWREEKDMAGRNRKIWRENIERYGGKRWREVEFKICGAELLSSVRMGCRSWPRRTDTSNAWCDFCCVFFDRRRRRRRTLPPPKCRRCNPYSS